MARFLALGDVLLVLPLVETLARSAHVSSVDVVTSRAFGDLLQRSRHVRRVFQVAEDGAGAEALGLHSYDVLVDLHTRSVPLPPAFEALVDGVSATTRRGFQPPEGLVPRQHALEGRRYDEHAVECYARCAGDLIDGPLATGLIDIARSDAERAVARLPANAVSVAPGARYAWKRWPTSRFAELVRILRDHGLSPVLVGHTGDQSVVDEVARATSPRPNIVLSEDMHALAVVMRASGVVVANNSGMAHLAQVAGARVVCIHSHTLPEMWRPWGPGHENVRALGGSCGCTGLSAFERATPCGLELDPSEVAEAVLRAHTRLGSQ